MAANPTDDLPAERSLDPEDWETIRRLGHRAWDDMVDYLATVRERPVWQPIPERSKAVFFEPVPRSPSAVEDVYELVREHVLPYPTNNIHPRFWSWVGGTGTPTQMIADMVMSAMNSASLGFDEAGIDVRGATALGLAKVVARFRHRQQRPAGERRFDGQPCGSCCCAHRHRTVRREGARYRQTRTSRDSYSMRRPKRTPAFAKALNYSGWVENR